MKMNLPRSPLSEEKYPNRNPAWKQALLIIDFQGDTRKGSSTSLSEAMFGSSFEKEIQERPRLHPYICRLLQSRKNKNVA